MHTDSIRISSVCTGCIILLLLVCSSCAVAENPEISCTGQVVWIDLEGGFYGIVAADGTQYLPLNLPENYQVDGVTVDITGTLPADIMTIQMWGQPMEITTIKPVQGENVFLEPWNAGGLDMSTALNETQAIYLTRVASGLSYGLDRLDSQISSIAQNLTRDGITSENLRDQLNLGTDIPGVYETVLMDTNGRIAAIVPDEFEEYVGTNVSYQELNSRSLSYPVPGMSEYFSTVEGIGAVMILYPVFSDNNTVAGYVSALFRPENLTEIYALSSLEGTDFDLLITQPDGVVLYDVHPDMIGRNMWEDREFYENYPDLLTWAADYQNADAGMGQYTYYRPDTLEDETTDAIWTTITLHGTPWRVALLSR